MKTHHQRILLPLFLFIFALSLPGIIAAETQEDEFILSETVMNSDCDAWCNGSIDIEYTVNDPNFEPLNHYWKDEWGTVISSELDLTNQCAGNYTLFFELENTQVLSYAFEIINEDLGPPEISRSDLSFQIGEDYTDYKGESAYTSILTDTLMKIELPCTFADYEAGGLLSDIQNYFINGLFVTDHCSDNFTVTFTDTEYRHLGEKDFITSGLFRVFDQAGNEDSLEVAVYLGTVYTPEYNEIIIDYPDGISKNFKIYSGVISESIIIEKDKSYIVKADVDPVCKNNPVITKWDLDNDGLYDREGNLEFSSDEPGEVKIFSKAYGTSISNTFSEEISFNFQVLGFTAETNVVGNSCNEICDGNIDLLIDYSGADFEPVDIKWQDEWDNELLPEPDGSLSGLCSGTFTYIITLAGGATETASVNLNVEDTVNPQISLPALDDFLFNSVLEERPGGYFYNDFASSEDTVFVGASCSVDFSEATSVFDSMMLHIDTFFSDNCDKVLDARIVGIGKDSSDFVDAMNVRNIQGDLFLASLTLQVTDDFANAKDFTLVVYYDGFHSPVLNEFITGYEGHDELNETIPFTFAVEVIEKEFIPDAEFLLFADIDPVCENADLEIIWDFGDDGTPDDEGDTLRITSPAPGSEKMSLTATSRGIRNSSNSFFFDLDIKGIKIDYEIRLGCSEPCDSEAEASITAYGDNFTVTDSEWIEFASGNSVSISTSANNLCLDKYIFNLSLADGSEIKDTLELTFGAEVKVTDNVCNPGSDGALELVKYSKTKNESTFAWYDQNEIEVSQDSVVNGLSAGNFTLKISDETASCLFEESYTVLPGMDNPVAKFDIQPTGKFLEADIQNNSENAVSFEWDFGDGNSSNEDSPTFTYEFSSVGEYEITLTAFNENNCPDEAVEKVTIELPEITGLEASDDAAQVFPNPTSGIVFIRGDLVEQNAVAELTGAGGQFVYNSYSLNQNINQIDVGNLKSGLYLLRITRGDTSSVHKIIKK